MSQEQNEFWEFVEKTSREVEAWPSWKKEGWEMLKISDEAATHCSIDQRSETRTSSIHKFD